MGRPTAEAMEALIQVHRRGYGYDPKAPSPVDYKLLIIIRPLFPT